MRNTLPAVGMQDTAPGLAARVTAPELGRANDAFGWGAVLSDDALLRMQANDPVSTSVIRAQFAFWGAVGQLL